MAQVEFTPVWWVCGVVLIVPVAAIMPVLLAGSNRHYIEGPALNGGRKLCPLDARLPCLLFPLLPLWGVAVDEL